MFNTQNFNSLFIFLKSWTSGTLEGKVSAHRMRTANLGHMAWCYTVLNRFAFWYVSCSIYEYLSAIQKLRSHLRKSASWVWNSNRTGAKRTILKYKTGSLLAVGRNMKIMPCYYYYLKTCPSYFFAHVSWTFPLSSLIKYKILFKKLLRNQWISCHRYCWTTGWRIPKLATM